MLEPYVSGDNAGRLTAVLGTTNVNIMSCTMGPTQPMGWSVRGGQTISAYGPGLDVGGSSTGAAVALSAGFCGFVIGSETDISLVSNLLK